MQPPPSTLEYFKIDLGKSMVTPEGQIAAAIKRWEESAPDEPKEFSHSDGVLQLTQWEGKEKGGLSLHISFRKPEQAATIVRGGKPKTPSSTTGKAKPEAESIHSAPLGHDYTQKAWYAAIKGRNLVVVGCHARPIGIHYFLQLLLQHSGHDAEAASLSLEPILNPDTMKVIREDGVASLDLGGSVMEATFLDVTDDDSIQGLIKDFCEKVKNLGSPTANADGGTADDNLLVHVSIKTRKRKKGFDLASEKLRKIAKTAVEEDDAAGLKIITEKGQPLTAESLRLTKKTRITRFGSTFSCTSAWKELWAYFDELKTAGKLSGQ